MEYFFNFEKLTYLRGGRPEGCILCLVRDHTEQVVDLTVYEYENFSVCLNLYPYNPGHLMVSPTGTWWIFGILRRRSDGPWIR